MGDEYVLPLSKVSKAERARVEAILERQKRDPMAIIIPLDASTY
jgi:hypothetical protein